MENKGISGSCMIVSGAKDDSLCAMYFGISCAFFGLKKLSEQAMDDHRCFETRERMLQGSVQLLGLLVWRVQKAEVESIEKCQILRKLEAAEREISELKRARSEDAKANERVASIYAAQEQSWFLERRKLRQQVANLMNDLTILDRRKTETISELNGRIQDMELLVKSKDRVLEEAEKSRKELQERVMLMEVALEELRETTKREAEEHSSELLKHKTAFMELVSNQRQLEAELGRALKQVEATKEQLDFVFDEKEEASLMVEELSLENEKMHKISEEKNKVLSLIMRKSKLASADRQLFLNEVKLSKQRRRIVPGSTDGRRTLRNMLSRQDSSRLEVFPDGRGVHSVAIGLLDVNADELGQIDEVYYDLDAEVRKECEDLSVHFNKSDFTDKFSEYEEVAQLEEWVHLEAEKYNNASEQRHRLELDAYAEQVHIKDDKLEAYRWRLLSAELESKRLHSQIIGLKKEMSQLRHSNCKLETLLLDREVELKTLKDQIALQLNRLSAEKTKSYSSMHDPPVDNYVRSKVETVKKKPAEIELAKRNSMAPESESKDTASTFQSPKEDADEKDMLQHSLPCIGLSSLGATGKEETPNLSSNKNQSMWKVDLHALGVCYKIKRLNQQLLMLDRLTGKQDNAAITQSSEQGQTRMKGFCLLLSLLNKQVGRYQSLQEKTDDLSKRMSEKNLDVKRGVSNSKRTKEETRTLEHFLEETFQLQRIIVATGQKLIELQSKITSGFADIADEFEGSGTFDMKRFAETMQTLFKDVQRGLEVRISRVIGDLGGTLACDGIHFRKYEQKR